MSITPITGWDGTDIALVQEQVGFRGVTFWPRVGARVIDLIPHYLVRYASGWLFGKMVLIASGGHVPRLVIFKMRHPGITGAAFALLGYFAYQVVLTTIYGSSVGKRILSMVVVQEDGSPCRFKSALIRELGYYIDAPFFGLIGYVAMERTEQQQRYGDEWAHTIVCKRELVAPGNLRGPDRFALALVLALMADSASTMLCLLLLLVI